MILSFFCPHPFCSLHFSRSFSLHAGVYFFILEDDWITPTEIAVTQILGHLPNPLGVNIQITPFFSAIHSGLLFLILWLQRLTVLLIEDNLQQFCLLIYLCLLCYREKTLHVHKGYDMTARQWFLALPLVHK